MIELQLEKKDLKEYLKASDIIDHNSENIRALAVELSEGVNDRIAVARIAYEYVRDNISHSFDINGNVVTCKASDVLRYKQGICYAKAHLLAALLRCLDIPTGFCYQKLILEDENKPFLVLHGLNAIYLEGLDKWIRVDARGNKEGVNAQFSVNEEKLAFSVRKVLGEIDFPVVYVNPDKKVINALQNSLTPAQLMENLPIDLA
jgi:transglutaminase-like putative cysteine protease